MRRFLRSAAGTGCLFALATSGCSADTDTAPESSPSTAYAPYVSVTDASDLDSAGSPTTYNLAFAISDGSGCTPKWNGTTAIGDSEVASRISALKKDGASVRVSFGGASGEELAEVCDSAEELAEAYGAALDAAGSTQADFDVEGDALADTDSVDLRSEAIALLQEEREDVAVSFTLPVMPSGLDDDALALLESANNSAVQVSTVNLMTMNYAEKYDGDMGDYALTAAKAAHTQLKDVFGTSDATAWGGMALTSMIGTNDVAGETFTLSDAAQVRKFAEEKGIGWVSMWATFRDQECTGDEDALTNCSGVQQSSGAFGEALAG
ncbi:hydrolase [Streptomyces sp. Act143]|uniref:chitinase n=1 Tax=Streptomyces sp. Act143 TaxID=2200760 RepID=UPI000D673C6B|nr:chitinase [Streptomyces sp. Act143]PWI17224.1 hydrolase [Streptomyces sp. Act143]